MGGGGRAMRLRRTERDGEHVGPEEGEEEGEGIEVRPEEAEDRIQPHAPANRGGGGGRGLVRVTGTRAQGSDLGIRMPL